MSCEVSERQRWQPGAAGNKLELPGATGSNLEQHTRPTGQLAPESRDDARLFVVSMSCSSSWGYIICEVSKLSSIILMQLVVTEFVMDSWLCSDQFVNCKLYYTQNTFYTFLLKCTLNIYTCIIYRYTL